MGEGTLRWSLRRRLLWIASATAVAAWLLGSAAMYLVLARHNDTLHDERLRALGQTVAAFAAHELAETEAARRAGGIVHDEAIATLGSRYGFQIWSAQGQLLLHSLHAPAAALPAPLQTAGFSSATAQGQAVRLYTLASEDGRYVIRVSEALEQRDAVALRLGSVLGLLFAASTLLTVAASGWLVRRALRPLDKSTHALRQREPQDFTPLADAGAPRELAPLLQAIDTLMARVGATLSAEQGFTAVAAHELRTPLAALRMHAQVAERARDAADRQRALQAVVASVDRLAHLVDQLLSLARLDGQHALGLHCEAVDLQALTHDIVAELGPLAAQREIRLELRLEVRTLLGAGFALSMLVRNLLSNAIAHIPDGGRIELTSAREGDVLVLRIDDSGPGIPQADRPVVFERFNRGSAPPGSGSGLGLSIVHSVARLHGATVALLDSPLGGLRVDVRFGPASLSPRVT